MFFSAPIEIFCSGRQKGTTSWKFFPDLYQKNISSEKNFSEDHKDQLFLVEVKKNYAEEKFFSSASLFKAKISSGFEKKFSRPKKILPLRKIDWEKFPRNFFALPFQQFQVLFYSPFEVLFIFPSQYFFAIGLLWIFSFWWITPPILSCISKQLDSKKPKIFFEFLSEKLQGYHLLWHCFPANFFFWAQKKWFPNATIHLKIFPSDFQHELFHFHSQLLMKSWLFSFPPLTDMLKFSGWSYLIWDLICKKKRFSNKQTK